MKKYVIIHDYFPKAPVSLTVSSDDDAMYDESYHARKRRKMHKKRENSPPTLRTPQESSSSNSLDEQDMTPQKRFKGSLLAVTPIMFKSRSTDDLVSLNASFKSVDGFAELDDIGNGDDDLAPLHHDRSASDTPLSARLTTIHSYSTDDLTQFQKRRKLEQLLGVDMDTIAETSSNHSNSPSAPSTPTPANAAAASEHFDVPTIHLNAANDLAPPPPPSNTISPSRQQSEDKKYQQALKLYRNQRKRKRIEICTQAVIKEFAKEGYEPQFTRDCFLWHQTLQKPGDERLSHILRRVFICMRYGGTLVRESKKKNDWFLWKHPIAALLSHGSRVMIQLPKSPSQKRDDSFWRWLLTGDRNGNTDAIMSTCWSSSKAYKENRIIFRRVAATHGITDNRQDKMDFNLPYQRSKIIHETKNRVGIKHSKFVGSKKYLFEQHRHWGMNVPLGGYGNKPYLFQRTEAEIPLEPYEESEEVSCNGDHGHMYIHYMPPGNGSFGGLLIGVEGSEPHKESANGEKHTYKATSPLISPTWGLKWRKKGKPALNMGPDKYNAIFIDLASTGWRFLQAKEKNWSDNFIYEGCQEPVRATHRISKEEFFEDTLAAYML